MNVKPNCLAFALIGFCGALAAGSIAQDHVGGVVVAVICLWIITLVTT